MCLCVADMCKVLMGDEIGTQEGDCERWQQLYKEGWTLQVHHPQRFSDGLTELCFSLEQQLGCLVGSNAYITPAGFGPASLSQLPMEISCSCTLQFCFSVIPWQKVMVIVVRAQRMHNCRCRGAGTRTSP